MYINVCCVLSRVWLCDPMGCSPPGSSVHGISQARILEWVAIPFSSGTSLPRGQTPVSCLISCIAGEFFTTGTTREELLKIIWIYSEESLQNTEILSAIPYEMATHSSILAWRQRAWQATVYGFIESDMTERLSLSHSFHVRSGWRN